MTTKRPKSLKELGISEDSVVGGFGIGHTQSKVQAAASEPEELLALQLRTSRVRHFVREHRFDSTRMWRFDFAWPDLLFAVEVEGITHGEGGRHQRAYGFELDLEKYQAAMLQGWTVYRCSPRLVRSAAALDTIVTMIEAVQQQR